MRWDVFSCRVVLSKHLDDHRLLCLGLFFIVTNQSLLLVLLTFLSPLTGSLGLRTSAVHLLLEESCTLLLGLGLVNLCPSVSEVALTLG